MTPLSELPEHAEFEKKSAIFSSKADEVKLNQSQFCGSISP